MKKVKLMQLKDGTRFNLVPDAHLKFTAKSQVACDLKGRLLRQCTYDCLGLLYAISINHYVYVDTDTAVIE